MTPASALATQDLLLRGSPVEPLPLDPAAEPPADVSTDVEIIGQSGHRSSGRFVPVFAVAIVVVATATRVAGMFNNLWLDEIWSLEIAKHVQHPLDVFLRLHHEINHYLNTLYIWLVGQRGNWPGYRLPSVVAGSATVVVAGLIGQRRGTAAALLSMAIFGTSYILVLYSSEARGYGTLLLFVFTAYWILLSYLDRPTLTKALLFSACCCLAILSQVIATAFVAAAAVLSLNQLVLQNKTIRQAAAPMLSCYGLPAALLVTLYFVDLQKMVVGGGTEESSLLASFLTALSWVVSPPTGAYQLPAAAAAIAAMVFGVRMLYRERPRSIVVKHRPAESAVSAAPAAAAVSDASSPTSSAPAVAIRRPARPDSAGQWLFFACIFFLPLALLIARGSDAVYTRHFILTIAFAQLLLAYLLAGWFERGGTPRRGAIVALVAFFLLNGYQSMHLLTDGRGRYIDALHYVADHTIHSPVTVEGDQDFRIGSVLRFYASQEHAQHRPVVYVTSKELAGKVSTDWLICHEEAFDEPSSDPELEDPAGNRFVLMQVFPAARLSGLHWFVYKNARGETPRPIANAPAHAPIGAGS